MVFERLQLGSCLGDSMLPGIVVVHMVVLVMLIIYRRSS